MFAQIAIDVPLRTLFTYQIPDEFCDSLRVGMRVVVPFGRKNVVGFCLEIFANYVPQEVHGKKILEKDLKKIESVIFDVPGHSDKTLLSQTYLDWLKFAADYYCAPIGQVLAQAVPAYYFSVKHVGKEREPKSRAIISDADFATKSVQLTSAQDKIFSEIKSHLDGYYPALLHGVTGSGKTEIYIDLIKEVLKQNKSALFLLPEIGLTPQMLARLSHHFKGSLLVYHSSLTQNQRLNQWKACLTGEPKVMVGTRSALFAPFQNLGLILVDEEHDHSYKQEDRFRYHARDLAVTRAHFLKIPIVLGSATPSLESYYVAHKKKYHYFKLDERIGEAVLPEIRVVDFAKEKEQTGLPLLVSQNIHQAIEHFYEKREQMILFVGQRGFAQNAFCVDCHKIQLCPNCSVGLKFHKPQKTLKCHYCDYELPFDEICTTCKQKKLTLLGFGTQSIEDEVRSMHPNLIIERLDSDTIKNAEHMQQILGDFAKQKINMLIGTQMISKGHDFSHVGFVGILGIDAHLGLPDFRASERAFQTLVQVAGRSGRDKKRGHVIVQSLMPDHVSIKLGVKQDYAGFADLELKQREELGYPPFSRIVQIRFLANHEKVLKEFVKTWHRFLENIRFKTNPVEIQILGPAEMPIAKVRGQHRYHVLFKIRRDLKSTEFVNHIVADLEARKLKGISFQVDVDAVGLV